MEKNIFTDIPHELKTIEVDVEKKIFKVNGVPFGNNCTAFSISCEECEGFKIRMDIDTTVHLASYGMDNGKLKESHTYNV